MRFQTDRQRAEGMGSAKEGVHHWWAQKITALALLVLGPILILSFGELLGQDHVDVVDVFGNPLRAVVWILGIGVAFYHLKLGLQVVIEDYIPEHKIRTPLIILNTLFCWAFGLAGVFAVIKLALGA